MPSTVEGVSAATHDCHSACPDTRGDVSYETSVSLGHGPSTPMEVKGAGNDRDRVSR
jgi:hypothetical protein